MTIAAVFMVWLCLALPACSGENSVDARELARGALRVTARPPRPGDWMEYRVAFPVDPLENSLRPDPAPLPQVDIADEVVTGVDGELYITPSFDQRVGWRILPLRLEVTAADALGFAAVLRFEKISRTVRFPIGRGEAGGEFYYDGPQPPDEKVEIVLDAGRYEGVGIRRNGGNYGFVRWVGEEAPFGLFRFATASVDLILVGMGSGAAPGFPLSVTTPIVPPPGALYGHGGGEEADSGGGDDDGVF